MMYENKKIKDVYNINLNENEISNHMDEWYYKLIQKTYDELEELDVSRMIVQKVCLEMAANKAIDFLLQNPICGIKWDGEILELFNQININIYRERLQDVKKMLFEIKKNFHEYDWLTSEDCEEYGEIVDLLINKIQI